jgi:hypothetical protein
MQKGILSPEGEVVATYRGAPSSSADRRCLVSRFGGCDWFDPEEMIRKIRNLARVDWPHRSRKVVNWPNLLALS